VVWVYAFAMVLISAVIGGLVVYIVGTRRSERAELLADIDAAETAPVPVVADITSIDLEPLPPLDMGSLSRFYYDPAPPPPGWVTTAATTGELHWIKQQMDLDDFALQL